MAAAQQTYTPLSGELSLQTKQQKELNAARRIGITNPTVDKYRQVKMDLQGQGVRDPSQEQVSAAVQKVNQASPAK